MVIVYKETGVGTGHHYENTFINCETTNHRAQLHPLVTRKMREPNVREFMLKTKRETN